MWIFSAIANAVGRNFIGRPNYLFDLLFNRVQADGGVTEAQQCTINELTDLQNDNLLSSASLVLTPSSYKEGTLYSVIPENGAGDMSVTRATTATRVNSAGLVELVPYNLFQYSQDFSNAAWTSGEVAIASNSTTAPDGTLTAETLTASTSNAAHYIFQGINTNSGSTVTFSCFVKNNGGNFVQLVAGAIGFTISNPYQNFNLINGTLAQGNIPTSTIENVGNGWFRISCTVEAVSSGSAGYFLCPILSGTTGRLDDFTGNGTSGIFIWGIQLNEGSTALPYQKTETRLNIPRLDYSNGTCPSLLVEPQRTNLLTYSSSFDNAVYTKISVTASANSAISPSGVQDADSILETATNSTHESWQRASMTSGQAYTQSCFFKANGRNRVIMQIFDNATQYGNAIFDLSTGVVVASFGGATIQEFENGWYRCTITGTSPATGLGYCVIGLCENTYSTPSVTPTYLGDITKGVYFWGMQTELGSYSTSYIPTTSASVTRNADVVSKTGISSLIGQTEGTLFFELQRDNTDNDTRLQISDGTTSNWLFVSIETGLNIRAFCISGGNFQFSEYSASPVSNATHKVAMAYKNNDVKVYVDGVSLITITSGSIPACSRLDVGNALPNGPVVSTSIIKALSLWKTALTNTQLAQLTTI